MGITVWRRFSIIIILAAVAMTPDLAHAAVCAPTPGGCCTIVGATAMASGGTDILACLHNANGSTPSLLWYRAGTNSIPICKSGYALNFDGASFVCSPELADLPTCAATQALTYDGTKFTCLSTQAAATAAAAAAAATPTAAVPAECPSVNTIEQSCPAGYWGFVVVATTTNCDGSTSISTQNHCILQGTLTTVSTISCNVGDQYYGTMSAGVFAPCAGPSSTSCQNYTCTVNGLQ